MNKEYNECLSSTPEDFFFFLLLFYVINCIFLANSTVELCRWSNAASRASRSDSIRSISSGDQISSLTRKFKS